MKYSIMNWKELVRHILAIVLGFFLIAYWDELKHLIGSLF